METLLRTLAHHGVLSSAQYWHLRLLSAIAFGPLLAVLYVVFFTWRKPRTPGAAAGYTATMWVDKHGRLLVRRTRVQAPA